MRIVRVKLYEVNGYEVCSLTKENLEEYLSDVPNKEDLDIKNKGFKYVMGVGKEFTQQEPCKELRHMKINILFNSEEDILNRLYKKYNFVS